MRGDHLVRVSKRLKEGNGTKVWPHFQYQLIVLLFGGENSNLNFSFSCYVWQGNENILPSLWGKAAAVKWVIPHKQGEEWKTSLSPNELQKESTFPPLNNSHPILLIKYIGNARKDQRDKKLHNQGILVRSVTSTLKAMVQNSKSFYTLIRNLLHRLKKV